MSTSNDPIVRQVVASEPLDPTCASSRRPRRAVPEQVVVAQPVAARGRRPAGPSGAAGGSPRRRGFRQVWDSIIVGAVGTVLLLFGLIAFVRAGTDGPWDQPVVEVLGFTHTATLGIVEMAFGVLLLLSAVSPEPRRGHVLRRPAGHRRLRRRRADRVVRHGRWHSSRRSPGGWSPPACSW